MSGQVLSIIVAMARNRVIGVDNKLPWHIPGDLKYFKGLTMGHHIIMGRKTYESIGRPLPGRTTVIVSRDPGYAQDGCLIAHSLDEAIQLAEGDDQVFFVGGSSLYEQALPRVGRLYITEIQADYDGDAHFPEFDRAIWREVSRDRRHSEDGLEFDYVVYER
ncbi:MAG TPA: dihydrofolate reductase [Parasulfuritortus sp.]